MQAGRQDETAASATGWHGDVWRVALHAEQHILSVEQCGFPFVCVCLHLQLDISSLDIPYIHRCCLGGLQSSYVFGSFYLAFPLFSLCHYYIPLRQLVECKFPHLLLI